jgi:hypothetical protein
VSTRGATARAAAPGTARPARVARPAPARAPQRRPVPRRAPARRSRLHPGLLLIPLIAALLAGIVWINVSKLAFTAETGRVVERARLVEAQNVRLKAQLDRVNATVVDRAQERLGMGVPVDSSITPLRAPAPAHLQSPPAGAPAR